MKADLISRITSDLRYKSRLIEEERVIPGKLGQLYLISEDVLGVLYLPPTPRKGWKNRKEELLSLGGTLEQDGDMEGTISYEITKLGPEQRKFIRSAASAIGAKRKREVSDEQRAEMLARLDKAREARGKRERDAS